MEPVLTSSIPVLFSSEKILSVWFSVLKKWGENWTELNFGNTTQASRGQEGSPTHSIECDCPSNEGVPSLGNPIPNSEAISAVQSYSDVVTSRPPTPHRERPVAPYEGSREDPNHGIGPEHPGVQSAVENTSQISSNLGSYEPEEEIETPDKIEYPPWTKVQRRRAHSHSPIRSNKKFLTSKQLRAVKIT